MAGHTLSLLPKNSASFVPAAQAMYDHDLVPEGAGRVDGGYPVGRQIESCGVLSDVGPDRERAVGLESRLRAGFDTDRRLHVDPVARLELGIPNEQGLPVGVGVVDLYVPGAAGGVGELRAEEFPEGAGDVGMAGIPDRVEPGSTFLVRQGFQFLHRRRLLEVVAEYRDVDVFGEALDQAVGFREGCATLEEQAGPPTGRSR